MAPRSAADLRLKDEGRPLRLKRNPACAHCGNDAEFPGYVDYTGVCVADF